MVRARSAKDHIERRRARASSPHDEWKLVRGSGILGLPFGERVGRARPGPAHHDVRAGGARPRLPGRRAELLRRPPTWSAPGCRLQRFGSAALKDRYLPAVCDGSTDRRPRDHASRAAVRTRCHAHHAPTATATTGCSTGSKTFVSNGAGRRPVRGLRPHATRTAARSASPRSSSRRDTPGFAVGKPIAKMGLRTSPMAEVFFDDCRVPATNVIGSRRRRLPRARPRDEVGDPLLVRRQRRRDGAPARAVRRATPASAPRSAAPIGSYQAVANRIVDMQIGVETTRKWLYDTAEKLAARRERHHRHRDHASWSPARRTWRPRSPRCRCSAATATWPSTAWRRTCATPSPAPSTRARPTSSATASPRCSACDECRGPT